MPPRQVLQLQCYTGDCDQPTLTDTAQYCADRSLARLQGVLQHSLRAGGETVDGEAQRSEVWVESAEGSVKVLS